MQKKLQVLVVDGSKDMLQSMANVLTTAGFAVHAAMTGREAVQRARELPKIGLVVLNALLPDNSGFTVLEELKSKGCRAPVVAVSASTDVGEAFLEAGAVAFIEKPFDIRELVALCRGALNGKKVPEKTTREQDRLPARRA